MPKSREKSNREVVAEQFDRPVSKSHQPESLVQFFRQSPLVGVDLDLERDSGPGRDIELTPSKL